jgi:hypothetical protein
MIGSARPESIERCIEGQAFLRPYDSAPRPPPLMSVSSTGDRQQDRKIGNLLSEGGLGGRGVEQESLVLYKSFNTLWFR